MKKKLLKPQKVKNDMKVQAYSGESGNPGCVSCAAGCLNCGCKGNCC